jgi:hypothetical protein
MSIGHVIQPPVFIFKDVESPCSYWSCGDHIVSNGKCRCGREFVIMERMPVEAALTGDVLPGGEF